MRHWVLQKLDAVLTQVVAAGIVALLVAAGLAVWAILEKASGPTVAGVAVMGFGGTLLAVNQGLSLWSRKKEPAPPSPQNEGAEEEERVEWLRKWDENQRQNWRQYIRLELLDVDCSHVNEASPYVGLKMVIRNFLLVPLKLVRVMDSSGTVAVHTLPSLPENYDLKIPPCSEREFNVKLAIHGTDVPKHLRSVSSAEHPRALEWVVTGTWQVEVYGSLQDAWDPSHKLRCQAMPNVPS